MPKITFGPMTLMYPAPVVLVGANVDGKPNFTTIAWAGVANSVPPMVSVAIRKQRYSHRGVEENQVFSVNIPGIDLAEATDYCGVVSGSKVNKAEECGFKVFYGALKAAPMIEQCPVNLECRLVHALKLGTHTLFIGQVEETYVSDDCLTAGRPDVDKIKPFCYVVGRKRRYAAVVGEVAEWHGSVKKLKFRDSEKA